MPERPVQSDQNLLNESIVCDVCGRFSAIEFGDRKLCPDCYEGCGSCCPEFEREEQGPATGGTASPQEKKSGSIFQET